jgi:hypothetical protein
MPVLAQQPAPFARATVAPRSVTVGQPVTLTLDVFVPTWFPQAPEFPTLDIPDAVVVADPGNINLNEQAGGATVYGVRQEYAIYPQRAEAYRIPPIGLSIVYAIDAKPSAPTRVTAAAPAFEATVPEAAKGLDYFVATTSFRLTASTDRKLENLSVGDSFTRTLTMTAVDAFAMMLPPLSFPPLDGMAVYPAQPVTSDAGGERSEPRTGKRVERVTYVLQKAGTFRLPAVEIAWWDTSAKTLRKASVAAVPFTVAPNPNAKDEIPLAPEPLSEVGAAAAHGRDWRTWIATHWPWLLAVFGTLLLLARLLSVRIRRRLAAGASPPQPPEAAFFRRVREAARSRDASALLGATFRWLDRKESGPDAARLDRFAAASGVAGLPELSEALESSLYVSSSSGPGGSFSADRFVAVLDRARRRGSEGVSGPALPPLNPPAIPELRSWPSRGSRTSPSLAKAGRVVLTALANRSARIS